LIFHNHRITVEESGLIVCQQLTGDSKTGSAVKNIARFEPGSGEALTRVVAFMNSLFFGCKAL
jgi:hypothetical protein